MRTTPPHSRHIGRDACHGEVHGCRLEAGRTLPLIKVKVHRAGESRLWLPRHIAGATRPTEDSPMRKSTLPVLAAALTVALASTAVMAQNRGGNAPRTAPPAAAPRGDRLHTQDRLKDQDRLHDKDTLKDRDRLKDQDQLKDQDKDQLKDQDQSKDQDQDRQHDQDGQPA